MDKLTLISSQFDKLRTPIPHDWVWPIASANSHSNCSLQNDYDNWKTEPIYCINTHSATKNGPAGPKLPQITSMGRNFIVLDQEFRSAQISTQPQSRSSVGNPRDATEVE